METRDEILRTMAGAYKKATRKEKGRMLDHVVEVTGYNRAYASHRLCLYGKRLFLRGFDGSQVILEAERKKPVKRSRRKGIYGPEVEKELVKIWRIMDYPCGKRLAAMLSWLVPKLEHHDELLLTPEVREKLQLISAATIDRMLSGRKKRMRLKARSATKPGTLLKQKIPVRTFADWDDARPGFMEMDMVAHEGGNPSGEYALTLTLTDVSSGWTELRAVKNKAEKWVFEALELIRSRLPFPLLGLDSDNDSAFINHHLYDYCQVEDITFTRSRPSRKNDNCFVEQKNWAVARRAVGYGRYDTEEEVCIMNDLYDVLRLYVNFFQPSAKLISKERIGPKVVKHYDTPKTPYQRLLESSCVDETTKNALRQVWETLNPADLKRRIDRFKRKLERCHKQKKEAQEAAQREPSFV
jgi:hypothetical protein